MIMLVLKTDKKYIFIKAADAQAAGWLSPEHVNGSATHTSRNLPIVSSNTDCHVQAKGDHVER